MNYYTAVSPLWLVAVSVCRRSGLLLIAVLPFWFVAVLTIDPCTHMLGLWLAPRVAVLGHKSHMVRNMDFHIRRVLGRYLDESKMTELVQCRNVLCILCY